MASKTQKVVAEAEIEVTKEVEAGKEPEVSSVKDPGSSLKEPLRRIVLASIGAIALAQDELEDFMKKLVERGEIAEQEAKKIMNEAISRKNKQGSKAEDEIQKGFASTLKRMNIPSKSDIEVLSEKINELSKKVDELKEEPKQS